ncbi:hypothetical protein A2833_02905 [Candidatus Azambacteria bacterium RIFCSPHIGHO2_01_FULL_44_55]|uniref:HTH HARE-type domain-containing protein n=1 Tax=Candidatus Azambacteria bacterium RIFCSPLOWO2_02_FULL_44_14 TaxID=1797306 RepID=A0A1F5CBQ4_9BACT|nr:MAG: hypothetical protein A3A18_02795 [Candidatus Azambacteria bacterium RIFCSPLOWO2_01_FULL_44_84]OGD33236.1 MAG: hypothetical protein A3C78_03200 [Candidatus Azambacteria bacterium RIFCSPHIGHO2_02_FULL_45_18]OGD40341.1 MAG: hypothetical protein A3I30_03560 [Candidatus Azambacteria bacterium RIFCSPLOWO2_02_FULL_44_14]OGD40704.1 MAG: hypothetical protein A2833_02905 [Candidatus Azambacteria bacterium RIFCSPHIGHO2_01_FULL_44_55]OGD52058.1 MAG: hypothetical protein A2608_01830 [Candidatus Azam
MAEQNFKNLLKDIISTLNPRTREIIEKRFGLSSSRGQTLEAIGKQFGITRERVRQIESEGLKQLSRDTITAKLEPVFQLVGNHLKACGGIRREDVLLKELGSILLPEEKKSENAVNFVLALGKKRLVYFEGNDNLHPAWSHSAGVCKDVVELASAIKKYIASSNKLLSHDSMINALKLEAAKMANLNPEPASLASYLSLSRHISKNPFGEWGLTQSPEVSPRGVKDKAYLVLKREQNPLHFRQVCDLINKISFGTRKAHPQTVHNELIKDSRFVLVGRGTYALRDWGYEPGTVKDVMVNVLKKAGGALSKEEIIKQVLSRRMVKENTILLNLQNRKTFKRLDNEKFVLA